MFCTGITNCILSQIQIVSSLMFYQEGPGETVQEGDSYLKYCLEVTKCHSQQCFKPAFFCPKSLSFHSNQCTETNAIPL